MAEQMQRSACMLVMEYVPGAPLFNLEKPFVPDNLNQTAADLGRSVLAACCTGIIKMKRFGLTKIQSKSLYSIQKK